MASIPQEVVPTTADDGVEINETTWDTEPSSSRVYAGRNSVSTFHAGFRFTGVPVPQGATVSSATLTLEVLLAAGTPTTTVYGADEDTAPAFSASARPSQFSKTDASATGPTAVVQSHPITITSVVQEIVSRGSWVSGNDMRFGVFHDGGGSGYNNVEICDITTWGNQNFATLDIDYTEGGGGGSVPVIIQQTH